MWMKPSKQKISMNKIKCHNKNIGHTATLSQSLFKLKKPEES